MKLHNSEVDSMNSVLDQLQCKLNPLLLCSKLSCGVILVEAPQVAFDQELLLKQQLPVH
jgi:hypothetical protein